MFAGMKIGFSLSRCVADLMNKEVEIKDVLIIMAVSNIDMKNEEHWRLIWDGYSNNAWHGFDEVETKSLVMGLWDNGKIHQSRRFGGHPIRSSQTWINVHIEPQSPAAKEAFDHYQTILAVSGELDSAEHQH